MSCFFLGSEPLNISGVMLTFDKQMKDKTNINDPCEQSFIIGSFVIMLFLQQICCLNFYTTFIASLVNNKVKTIVPFIYSAT